MCVRGGLIWGVSHLRSRYCISYPKHLDDHNLSKQLWSTKSYLWGVEIENKANKKDGKGVSNKYSQETTAVSVGGTGIPVPVEVEEASSSEDDEGEDNTFFFPIAIQQIKTSMGPLSQSKRYSIRS